MKQYIFSIALSLIMVSAGAFTTYKAEAQSTSDRFTITIDNEHSKVSPGGALRFHVQGTSNSGYDYVNVPISLSHNVSSNRISYASWHISEPTSKKKYMVAHIKKDIALLPKTVTITVSKNGQTQDTATFSIVSGNHGHPYPAKLKGKYITELRIESGKDAWYRFLCIENSAGTGHCGLDFKQGTYYPHDAIDGVINVPKHYCSDAGWTAGSKLAIRDPLVYNLARLVEKRTGIHIVEPGHISHESTICRIISDSPIIIEPVEIVPQYN